MITDKDKEDAKIIIDMVGGNSDKWREIRDYTQRIRAESAEQARKDYQDVIDDYRRLTKDLDIALNGDCAAKQASLCDIVAQVRSLGTITEIIMRSAEQARKEAAENVIVGTDEVDDILLQEIQSLKDQLRIAVYIIKQYVPEIDEGDLIHDLSTEDYWAYIENNEIEANR